MTTEDIAIPRTGEYVLIEMTTTQMTITNTSEVTMLVRFGSTSTSRGIPLFINDSVVVDTDVYIASGGAIQPTTNTTIVVTR